jgi:hypothetical protein
VRVRDCGKVFVGLAVAAAAIVVPVGSASAADAPIVVTTGGTTDYVRGTTAVTIDSGVAVSDLDSVTQSSATVSVSTGFHSGDALAFVNTDAALFGNVVGSYNAATGVLTLTSSGKPRRTRNGRMCSAR